MDFSLFSDISPFLKYAIFRFSRDVFSRNSKFDFRPVYVRSIFIKRIVNRMSRLTSRLQIEIILSFYAIFRATYSIYLYTFTYSEKRKHAPRYFNGPRKTTRYINLSTNWSIRCTRCRSFRTRTDNRVLESISKQSARPVFN